MKLLKKEWLFFTFLTLFFLLFLLTKPHLKNLFNSIDFATLRAIFVLLIITNALKLSNALEYAVVKNSESFKNERSLAYFLIFCAFFLSMFLTNDVTLFIIVPLTLAFYKKTGENPTKIVILEAIAVNAGSALTPFGNPQNLFLFRQMDISQLHFASLMAKIVIPQAFLLAVFVFILFRKKPIKIEICDSPKINKKLLLSTLGAFILFALALEFSYMRYLVVLLVLFYAFFEIKVLKIDYFLILTFAFMFMDFYMLSQIPAVDSFTKSLIHSLGSLNTSIILSQIMSNVPASIFISQFSHEYIQIAYGVNIAGNGVIIASLANIIALRLLNDTKAYLKFHLYSVSFFLLSYLIISL